MAYQIKLNIKGETCVFTRNGEPTLRDTTNALKVQQQQLRMLNRKDSPSNDDYDENEKNLAKFAVDFWKKQLKCIALCVNINLLVLKGHGIAQAVQADCRAVCNGA